MKAYILVEEDGSYSDYTKTNIAVFLDKNKADDALAQIVSENNIITQICSEIDNAKVAFGKIHKTPKQDFHRKLRPREPHVSKEEYRKTRLMIEEWNDKKRAEFEVALAAYREAMKNHLQPILDKWENEIKRLKLEVSEYFQVSPYRQGTSIEEVDLLS